MVNFFGGSIDYDDSDSTEVDYALSKPRKNNSPGYGKEWDDFQKAMSEIKPLTTEDLDNARRYAAYK